jgi:hypothetical protein
MWTGGVVTLIRYIVLMIATSRVGFSSFEARCLAARWDSPVVVTTAVQFSLAARDTASLRKLHQVAGTGSAIFVFVDEAHAAVPPALWPQLFRWLRELCENPNHNNSRLATRRSLGYRHQV